MQRVCFRLRVRLDRLDEYVQRHEAVWPEMQRALTETGWTNYSLFLDRSDGTLIGYFETQDLAAARDGMADLEINRRWQAEMAGFFADLGEATPDAGFTQLDHIFLLNEHL
jgi:L-rhamnose mutarotase